MSILMPDIRLIWIELKSLFELPFRLSPIPVVVKVHERQHAVSLGKRLVSLQSLGGGIPHLWKSHIGRKHVEKGLKMIRSCQLHVGWSVVRIQFDRLGEIVICFLQIAVVKM